MSDSTLIALYLRRLEQRVAALERLEHGSGGGGLDFDDITDLDSGGLPVLVDEFPIYKPGLGAYKATIQGFWDSFTALGAFPGGVTAFDSFPVYSSGHNVTAAATMLDVFEAITDIDGTGSGLDADLLDGSHATDFAAVSHSHSAGDITSGTLNDARIPSGITRDSEVMSIVLAADGHSSGLDADTIDGAHYEVNNWTPALTIGGSATGITYNTSNTIGVYTKIGRYVHVAFRVALTDKGSNTGAVVLTGLPYAISSSSPSSGSMRYYTLAWLVNVSSSPNGFVVLAGLPGSSTITLTIQEVTGTGGNLTNAHLANNSDIRGELWYLTD